MIPNMEKQNIFQTTNQLIFTKILHFKKQRTTGCHYATVEVLESSELVQLIRLWEQGERTISQLSATPQFHLAMKVYQISPHWTDEFPMKSMSFHAISGVYAVLSEEILHFPTLPSRPSSPSCRSNTGDGAPDAPAHG